MPTHDPARKRRAFRRVPRKRKVFVEASPRAESEHTCARAMYDYGKDVVQPTVCEQACTGPMLLGSLKDLAYLVWESDYASLFELEKREYINSFLSFWNKFSSFFFGVCNN